MAQFRIIESRPATYCWEYIVEADSETEALNKVLDGKIEADQTWCDIDDEGDSDFELYSDDDEDGDFKTFNEAPYGDD
jgi:hypothetical protein